MAQGSVKWFNDAKGFGFITPDDWSKDVFVHGTNVAEGELVEGDAVEFDIGEWRKGPEAKDVKKI